MGRIYQCLLYVAMSLLLEINPIHCLSGCDDVDITFLIDIKSIINNGDNIEEFVQSILWDGSSEYSAFSVILYGDNIPNVINNIQIIELDDNVNITQRADEEERIIKQLDQVFEQIFEYQNHSDTKNISLLDAFNIADDQHKPERCHKKRDEMLNEYYVGILDDENVYFIFDYQNILLSDDNNDELCFLLNHNEQYEDETIHFLTGQSYDSFNIDCNGEQPKIYNNTFFHFDDLLTDNHKKEQLLDITCPAYIIAPQYGGIMNLGNHVQWIDINTFIGCHLEDINTDNSDLPLQINSTTSYIVVKDYIDDDNTFKVNDYLLSFPEIQSHLKEMGCEYSIYKINNIEIIDIDTYNNYNIIKLYVSLPESPLEYINDAAVGTDNNPKSNSTANEQRRRMTIWEDIGAAIDKAWISVKDKWDHLMNSQETGGVKSHSFPDYDKHHTWHYAKDSEATKSFTTEEGTKLTFTGDASMELTAGYKFHASVVLYFKFYWHLIQDQVHMMQAVEPDFKLDIDADAEFTGKVKVAIKKILDWSKYFDIQLGPVPVIVKPFITLDATLETIPITVKAGIKCTYGEKIKVGYEYKNYDGKLSNKIWERHPRSDNGCTTPTLELGAQKENIEACPATALGFDISVDMKIGVNLYSMITVYGRPKLQIPFRLNIPEQNNAVCSKADISCNDGNYLQASFTVGPMYLTIDAGIKFELSILEDVLPIILGITKPDADVSIPTAIEETQVLSRTQILPSKSLGCISLSDGLSLLNTHYKSKCCPLCGHQKAVEHPIVDGEWGYIGRLRDFEILYDNKYSKLKYEFGVKYNGALGVIHRVQINSWNVGLRISTVDGYPMGDDAKSLKFGRVVFTKGLHDNPTSNDWYQYYFYNVNDEYVSTDGRADCTELYARSISNRDDDGKGSWVEYGTLGTIEHLFSQEKDWGFQLDTEYGVLYNDAIHSVTMNTWNQGIRISTVHEYPFGDTSKTLKFGKTIFTKGLSGNPTSDSWYHYYYYMTNDAYYESNAGPRNSVKVYRRQLPQKLEQERQLKSWSDMVLQGFLDWPYEEMYVQYNSAYNSFHKVIINGWNRGIRMTTIDDYPMGDASKSLKFGRTTLTYALISGDPTYNNWYNQYYQVTGDKYWFSNQGNRDQMIVYMDFMHRWEEVGLLKDIENTVKQYSPQKYRYGVVYNNVYNGDIVHEVTINSWHKGLRVSTKNSYPMGDDAKTLKFGKVVFTKGLDNSQTTTDWYHSYYHTGDDTHQWSNGNANNVRIFVKTRDTGRLS